MTRLARLERRVAAAAVVGVAAIASFQALVAHPVVLWFDVDPASDPFPFAGIAPSTGMALDAVTLALAAVALWCARRGIDRAGRWVAFLAGAGAVVAFIHATADADQCWRAMQWVAAVVGGTAVAVVLRALGPVDGRAARRAAIAVLLAAAVPVAWRGALQVLVEHPATVAHFRAHKAEFLAARGWAEGSPQALTYERRLMQPEATAWFGLANVASSVLAAGAVAFAGAAVALRRARPAGTAMLGIVAIGCATLVAVNGSKGALTALAIGTCFAAWCAWRAPTSRARARVALALLALPLVAVCARAVAGLASGERSLLFRAHYAGGALRMVRESPVLGEGPAGFGPAYLRLRPWDSPEEVQSAHAAWADWIASLGLGGVAWIIASVAVVAWVARAACDGRGAGDGVADATADGDPGSAARAGPDVRARLVPFLVVLAVGILAIVPEAPALDEASLAARVLAALFAAACASVLVRAFEAPGRALAAGLAGAALALAVHSQVEMTLWWPGALAWVACVVGSVAGGAWSTVARAAADGSPVDPSHPCSVTTREALARASLRALVAVHLVTAAVVMALEVPGARSAEAFVARAAEPLAAFGRARLGIGPAPARTIADARFEAAGVLDPSVIDFVGSLPRTQHWLGRPAVEAASLTQYAQGITALEAPEGDDVILEGRLREVLGMLAERSTIGRWSHGESVVAAAGLLAEAALARARAAGIEHSLAAAEVRTWGLRQVELNPRSVRGWMRAAEGAAALGEADDAARFAGNALGVDLSYALDPMRRMGEADRARMQAIIDAAEPSRP